MEDKNNLLELKDLKIRYVTDRGTACAVNGININLKESEVLGLVGETGAGKTTTALGIMRLLPERTGEIEGEINFQGINLAVLTEKEMQKIRGHKIGMIFQDPMTSLNPVITVGDQIREVMELHTELTSKELDAKVDEMLEMVGIPKERKNEFPHQFSGGMKQRVVIAMSLAGDPELLIADEPTTALDVTIQAQVINMMIRLKNTYKTSIVLITHDLGIVAQMCDKVAIMYAGEIIESGTAEDIYMSSKHHPYTDGLFGSIPDMTKKTERLNPISGLAPDAMDLPKGCPFHERCPKCMEVCKTTHPQVYEEETHSISCHLYTMNP